MTINISWKWIKPYNENNQGNAPQSGGVYEILAKNDEGKYNRKYVGSADNLNKRYGEHLSSNEPNQKIKNGVKSLDCAFDYYVIDNKSTRENVENWLYHHHTYPWNECEPPGNGNQVEVTEEN